MTRRRWLFGLGATFVFAIAMLGAGNVAVYSSNATCGSCHEIKPLYDQWHSSTHKNVNCVSCHTDPGLAGWAKLNVNIVVNGFKHLTGAYTMPIQGKVDDASCLRCHSRDSRPEVIAASSLRVAHSAHNQLRCADCHGRLVHTSNTIRVAGTTEVAAIPMAKSHQEKDCVVCHQVQDYLHKSNNVACSSCHSANIPQHDIAQQQGTFPMQSCLDCHKKLKVSSPENCATCHVAPHPPKAVDSPAAKISSTGQVNCSTCHTSAGWKTLSVQHDKIWDGYTGVHATLGCTTCHKTGKYEKLSTSCDTCHTRPHADRGPDCSTCHKNPGVKWI